MVVSEPLASMLRLRLRHARAELNRLLFATGMDLDEADNLMDRLYLLYVLALLFVWACLSWSALRSQLAQALLPLGVEGASLVLAALPLFSLAYLSFASIRSLCVAPWTLCLADLLMFSGCAAATRGLLLIELAMSVLRASLAGAALALLVSSSIREAPVAVCCLFLALLMSASSLLSWALGLMRLEGGGEVAAPLGKILVPMLLVWTISLLPLLLHQALSSLLPAVAVVLLALLPLLALWCVRLSGRTCLPFLAEESLVQVDRRALLAMATTLPQSYARLRRQRRNERRGPIGSISIPSGPLALLAHGALSLLRHYESLPGLVAWVGIMVPAGLPMLGGRASATLLLPWIAACSLRSLDARVIGGCFLDAQELRALRCPLPFGTLALLFFSSLPALALSFALSVLSWALMGLVAEVDFLSLALLLLIDLLALLSCGLSAVRLPITGWRLGFELSLLLLLGLLSLPAAPSSSLIACRVGLALVFLTVLCARFGRECG